MPNWCFDRLEVIGEAEVVANFKSASTNADGDFSFDCLVPMPEALRKPDGGDGWYNWSVDNWGTKWDVRGDEVYTSHDVTDEGLSRLTLDFTTAWAPPSEWLQRVAPLYPTLQFTLWFDEPGACFAGKETFINGTINYERSWSGDSVGTLNCAVATCDEWVDGRAVFDFETAPTAADLEVFCEDHALVEAVVGAVRAGGEPVDMAKADNR